MTQSGRTYLITGAANRIGRGLAIGLSGQADTMIIHYNSSETAAKQLSQELNGKGVNTHIIAADLESPDQVKNLLSKVWQMAGPVDILINSASIFEQGRLAEISMDDIHRNMMVNALSPFLLSRSFVEMNKSRQSPALPVIINMLDSRITDYDRQHAAYHLAKRTLFTLTKMMALEFAPGVRVNAVAPGLILPPRGKDRSYLEQLKSSNPLNRIGDVDQIVEAVRFLVNNEFVTGQVIYVDGGRHLTGNVYG